MSTGDRYEAHDIFITFEYNSGHPSIALPHQCDFWTIGGVEEARALMRDLEDAITAMERADLKQCAHDDGWPCQMAAGAGRYCREHEAMVDG